jgi:hypothetical protein
MRKRIAFSFLLVFSILSLLSMPLYAQDAQKQTEKAHKSFFNKTNLFLGLGLTLTGVADIETTYWAKSRGAYEGNPALRPFINAGRWAAYPVKAGSHAAVLYGSYRLRQSHNKALRIAGWILPVSAIVSQGWLAHRNYDKYKSLK